jgi:signal transduction histidine kinase
VDVKNSNHRLERSGFFHKGAKDRESLKKKFTLNPDTVSRQFKKRHWLIIVGVTFLILIFEIFELFYKDESFTDPFHLIELLIYFVILVIVGILINFLAEANHLNHHTLEILNAKHNISLDLIKPENWENLTTKLVTLPGKIALVDASQLHIRDPHTGHLELISTWEQEKSNGKANFIQACQKCTLASQNTKRLFQPCDQDSETRDPSFQSRVYCLPLVYADQILAVVKFKTTEDLSLQQVEIFESIQPELSLALKASQEQIILSELQQTQAALAERHSISNYLHDTLSQNLAYLCLKLDQLSEDNKNLNAEQVKSDFDRMKDTANQSYEIIRGTIETIYPKTTPRLSNLFSEYSQKIAQRADFEISIVKEGDALPILPEIQQAVFYVFQEALSNIEKYAQANQVEVTIQWGDDSLSVTVADDGVGFDPQSIDGRKHFGLKIIKERIEKLGGQLEIISSENNGTTVTFFIPVRLPLIRGKVD